MEEILSVFIQESMEQLEAMEAGLLALEQGQGDAETLNAIFRAAHTIKGGAGIVELDMLEHFTHDLESTLDQLRNGEIQASGELVSVLLHCCDHLAALLDLASRGNLEAPDPLRSAGQELTQRLHALLGKSATASSMATTSTSSTSPAEHNGTVEAAGKATAIDDCWHVSVRFGQDVMRQGMDPAAVLRFLLSLGEIVHITTLADAMPDADEMDPESCYLGCEIRLRSHADKAQIERVFDFIRDDCELRILPPDSKVTDYIQLINELPEEAMRLGEILIRSGALTRDELDEGLSLQASEPTGSAATGGADPAEGQVPRLGGILVENKFIQQEIVEAAAVRQKQINERKADEARLIRVHADKLDQLIDLVGELVIAGASTRLLAQHSRQGNLIEAASVLTRLVENIRDAALQLRMVPIGETFNRFPRLVRDTARDLGKEFELVISGGETELDKSVVEKIGDPLMHLMRNAMDHGIESPEVRLARGKPACGRVMLNACHDSGSIIIEVADDGGGLPREKIRAKAVERGLISASQTLTEREIDQLIFEAGFSTADKVTNLSGRGVGMDVVRRNIQALRGSLEVISTEGVGCRFVIRLPLTLAIIDGFLVGVGRSSYVIPLEMVVECIELSETTSDRHYINLRGEVLPFVRLRELFEIDGPLPRRENIVVVRADNRKIGIVVDVLQGEFQTVIKPLGALFRHLRGIGGSTILGSGEVALILDVQALTQIAVGNEEQRLAPRLAPHPVLLTQPIQLTTQNAPHDAHH
jgi:two-component system chemotaxis sensor kinase CheA